MQIYLGYKKIVPSSKETALNSSKFAHSIPTKNNHILNIFYIYSTKAGHCKLFFTFWASLIIVRSPKMPLKIYKVRWFLCKNAWFIVHLFKALSVWGWAKRNPEALLRRLLDLDNEWRACKCRTFNHFWYRIDQNPPFFSN